MTEKMFLTVCVVIFFMHFVNKSECNVITKIEESSSLLVSLDPSQENDPNLQPHNVAGTSSIHTQAVEDNSQFTRHRRRAFGRKPKNQAKRKKIALRRRGSRHKLVISSSSFKESSAPRTTNRHVKKIESIINQTCESITNIFLAKFSNK